MNGKSFLKSWTMWFSAALFVLPDIVGLLEQLVGAGFLPEDITLRIVAILNVLLRIKTTQPVLLTEKKE